jgi:uncharacterized protein DUF4145
MAELVANCPRCGAQSITMNVTAVNFLRKDTLSGELHYEAFGVCRNCFRGTTFVIYGGPDKAEAIQGRTLNQDFKVRGYINLKDQATVAPPEHVPSNIANVFREGATCLAVECWNAAGTMFRLCVDLTTQPMLPAADVEGLNARTRRDLGLRLPWLFENGKLPADLRKLSTAIREDGNDGAHQGTLTKEDAEDLLDFTRELLERIYTEPKQLELAEQRRQQRRAPKGSVKRTTQ